MKLKFSIIIRVTAIVIIMTQFETTRAIQWENVEHDRSSVIRRSAQCEFPETELKETKTITLTDCGNYCQFSWDCTHFVWNQNGTCWIKTGFVSDDTAKAISDPNTFCGHLIIFWQNSTRSDNSVWSFNCGFPSDRNLEFKTSRGEDCGGLCHANPNCSHFTWTKNRNLEDGICQMKYGSVSRNDAKLAAGSSDGSNCGFQKEKEIAFEVAIIKWENVEPATRQSAHCTFPGTELITTVKSKTLFSCRESCQYSDGCTHFVWNQNGTCWMKTGTVSDATANAISDPNTFCGHLIILWQSSTNVDVAAWSFNCDFPSDRDFKAQPSKGEDCGGLCHSNPQCSHFTWTNHKSVGGICRMKFGDISRNDAILTPGSRGIGSVCGFEIKNKKDPIIIYDDNCDCDCINDVF